MKNPLIILFSMLSLFVAAKDETVGILATVNGTPVTLNDVVEITSTKEKQLPLLYKGEELQKELWKVRKQALQTIIERKLVFEDFKKYEYKLPRDFVESNMDMLLKAFNLISKNELESLLNEDGKTLTEFESKVYESVAVDALIYGKCYKDTFVTPQEVSEYYDSHKSEFTVPASVKLQVITLKKTGMHKQNAEELSKLLEATIKSGGVESFKDCAALYSDGPNVKEGGDIGWVPVPELRKEFLAVIKNGYKTGNVYGPIDTAETIFFVRIEDYKESKTSSYEESKLSIREKLTEKAKEKSYNDYITSLKSKAYITYYI